MNKTRRTALIGIVAIIAGGAGLVAQRAIRSVSTDTADPGSAKALLGLQFPDLAGKPQAFSQWNGRLLLVNFWATWCGPCREEIPALVRLQGKDEYKNLQIVGISIDSVAKVIDFSAEFKINYPLVIGGLESIDLTRQLGNRAAALPFTVLIAPDGRLLATHLGGMNDHSLAALLKPHVGS